ncbi:unnamed protein product [Lactuca saligna]|uniref:Uncharacterized protein n=1 Tax=Lactuca saligna TaxID=75948 RepID=A0AA36A549_LACSI|nr:unnamed protein product [Lactuca saligna]
MDQIKSQHEARLKRHADNFQYVVKDLREVAKEFHILFVEEVQKVEKVVKLQTEAIKIDMSNEIAKLDQNYSTLHYKVDVIVDVVTKDVEFYNCLNIEVDSKTAYDSKVFAKLEEFLGSLKESLSKINVSPSSSVSMESLSKISTLPLF